MAEDIGDPVSLDDLRADSGNGSRGCRVCNWIEGRSDASIWDQAFAESRLDEPTITARAICRAMRKRGFAYKEKPVDNHRRDNHRV